jgi:hypothetical protein
MRSRLVSDWIRNIARLHALRSKVGRIVVPTHLCDDIYHGIREDRHDDRAARGQQECLDANLSLGQLPELLVLLVVIHAVVVIVVLLLLSQSADRTVESLLRGGTLLQLTSRREVVSVLTGGDL